MMPRYKSRLQFPEKLLKQRSNSLRVFLAGGLHSRSSTYAPFQLVVALRETGDSSGARGQQQRILRFGWPVVACKATHAGGDFRLTDVHSKVVKDIIAKILSGTIGLSRSVTPIQFELPHRCKHYF
jgi:hypothetical protein